SRGQDWRRDRRCARRSPGTGGVAADGGGEWRLWVMTAPLRASEPTVVRVALGERSYDIVIGRGVLASLGQRIAALRPAARVAIVSDETVARHWLARCAAAPVATRC